MRLIFAGTPEIAAVVLTALLNSEHQVVGVLTQPDRPAGRGRQLQASPVKVLATQHNLPVLQPTSLKSADIQQTLAAFDADLMVVVAYGLIVPQAVLEIPKLGCWNIHVSLLPRWRGAAPIQRALEAGDTQTGVTIMQMDKGLDTGDILRVLSTEILPEDTAQTLHNRLAKLGVAALFQAFQDVAQGALQHTPQADKGITYANKLIKAEAVVDWRLPAEAIHNKVRAFNPWPVAFTEIEGTRVRLWQTRKVVPANTVSAPPGEIIAIDKESVIVQCGEGQLAILQAQLPGGRCLPMHELLRARHTCFVKGNCFKGVEHVSCN